jgi:thymidylate kinase
VARRREAIGDQARGLTWLAIKALGFATHLAEEQYRHALARRHRARGGIVVFDRYTLDANVNARLRRTPTSWARRLRDALLQAGACRPDLVLVLDAPGEVLYARKGEHSPGRLEQMRRAYSALAAEFPEVVVIDASRDAGAVCRTVTSLLWARRCAGYAAVRTPDGAGRP